MPKKTGSNSFASSPAAKADIGAGAAIMETIPYRRTEAERPRFPWRIFWLLLIASVLGVVAVLPYIFSLSPKLIAAGGPLPMPLPVLIAAQIMQSTIVFAALIALGLMLARNVGLELPVLQWWLYGKGHGIPRNAFRGPILIGLAVAGLSLLVFYTVFLSRIPEWPIAAEAALPIWKRLLASLYGAINEEIMARLFFFSLIVWLLRKIARQKIGRSGPVIFWTANLTVALLFALGHIPAARLLMPITPLVIIALLTINGAASLVFGYLSWKRGLEAAMLAHFCADFTLHVIGPMFFRG